jgi:hypothetical protein
MVDDRQFPGMISVVSLRLLYLIFQHALGLLLLMSLEPVGAENYVMPPDQRLRGRPRDRRPATGDQHDRSLWPSDSPTSRSDAC